MANGDLRGTLTKDPRPPGTQDFAGLGPEASQALSALLSIQTGPSQEDLQQGEEIAGQAFQSVQQEISGRTPPPGVDVPDRPSPLGTFLSVFLANVGAQAARDPSLARPTLEAVQRKEQERAEAEEFNFETNQKFRDQQVKDRLIATTKQTMEALDIAQKSGDDKTAAAKAGQLARLNSLLRREEEQSRISGRISVKRTVPGKAPPKDKLLGPKPELTEAQFNDDIKAIIAEERALQRTVRPLTLLEQSLPKAQERALTKRKQIGRKQRDLRRRKIDVSLLRQPGDTPEEMIQRVFREVPELQNRPPNDPEILRIARIVQGKFPEAR